MSRPADHPVRFDDGIYGCAACGRVLEYELRTEELSGGERRQVEVLICPGCELAWWPAHTEAHDGHNR